MWRSCDKIYTICLFVLGVKVLVFMSLAEEFCSWWSGYGLGQEKVIYFLWPAWSSGLKLSCGFFLSFPLLSFLQKEPTACLQLQHTAEGDRAAIRLWYGTRDLFSYVDTIKLVTRSRDWRSFSLSVSVSGCICFSSLHIFTLRVPLTVL